jgi:hypothetical protein
MFRRWLERFKTTKAQVVQASAYLVDSKVVICASSLTRAGFSIDDGPRLCPPSGDAAALGEALLQALRGARTGIAVPSDYEAVNRLTLEAAGVGPRRFRAAARLVFVQARGADVTLTPAENRGKDGFHGCPVEAVRITGLDPNGLGGALQEAFDRAR